MRAPKRASKIRKLFNLTKDDDMRKCVQRLPSFIITCFCSVMIGQKPTTAMPHVAQLL